MAAVERDIVPDGDIVTDLDGRLLIEGMEDGAVLDIDVVADADGVDVTAEDGVKPDAAALPEDDISDDGSVDSEEAVLTDLRRDASYSLYECHECLLLLLLSYAKILLLSYAKIMNPWGKDDAYISPIEGPPLPFTPHH